MAGEIEIPVDTKKATRDIEELENEWPEGVMRIQAKEIRAGDELESVDGSAFVSTIARNATETRLDFTDGEFIRVSPGYYLSVLSRREVADV